MKRNQAGFSVIAIILAIVVAALLGFAAWRVYSGDNNPKQSTNNAPVVTNKEHTDTTNTLTFKYPSNWTITEYVWEACCEGPKTEPDWTKIPQPIELKPDGAHEDVKVSITADKSGAVTIKKELEDGTKDQFNTYTQMKINGYDALYRKVDFVGPAEVEAYTDHYYTIVDGKKSVKMYFREKYRHNWNNEDSGGKTNYDASSFLSDFEAIVNSVQFLD